KLLRLGSAAVLSRTHSPNSALTAYDLPFEQYQRRRGRLVKIDDSAEMKKIMSGLPRLKHDLSFAEYLRKYRADSRLADARRFATDFVEGFDAADPERISAKSLAEEQEGLGNVED